MPKMVHFGEFLKSEACGQTVLPDMPILIGQKLVENAKNEKSNETICVIFNHCKDVHLLIFFSIFFIK